MGPVFPPPFPWTLLGYKQLFSVVATIAACAIVHRFNKVLFHIHRSISEWSRIFFEILGIFFNSTFYTPQIEILGETFTLKKKEKSELHGPKCYQDIRWVLKMKL